MNRFACVRCCVPALLLFLAACGGGGSGDGVVVTPPDPDPVFGLDSRPSNQTCVAPQRAQGSASVSVADAFPNLPAISQPVKALLEPVANPRWFVLGKGGVISVFDPLNATSVTTWLDLSSGFDLRTASEGGLLGMAFHPDYPAAPEIFLYYTRNHTGPAMRTVVSRFILDDLAAPGAGTVEQVILEVDQDFDNHNGGDIAFGADRFLYIGLGDGGSGGDPNERAQDTTHLLGSMLRIDVLGAGVSFPSVPYTIPAGNPFAGNALCGPSGNAASCPEIYAWGLRNPWRWSFDAASGALWAADVGQNQWEEIDLIEPGGNYGWDCREGAHDFEPNGCSSGLIDPVAEYAHANGNASITGGFVYRGSEIAALAGRYVFGDFASGRIWALQSDGQGGYTMEELANTATGPSSFAADANGELYFTDLNNGQLMRLEAAGSSQDPVAELLSDSGCVDPANITQAYAGLIPYDINAPFWSDGAAKERFIGVPDGETISIDANDDWVFPPGTVLVKNFRLGGQLIETRHLMRHPDGVWAGYTYEWNASQTEATRVRGGKVVPVAGQDWIFPDEAECMRCHTSVATVALGPETAQLNKSFTYSSTGRDANQLETLDHIMLFASPLSSDPASLPALTDPADTAAGLMARARAYLHTNCASCHQPGGPTPVDIDLRYTTALADMNACDVVPQAGGFGTMMPRIIAPGDSGRSVLLTRMNMRGPLGMPPVGSAQVDANGVTLIGQWIDGLQGCN